MNNIMHELGAIVHRAAQAESSAEQLTVIVNAICDILDTDVCSLYIRNSAGDMELAVSHGLVTTHPQVIPAGRGIVGEVVAARHTINIIDPEKHPSYYYLAESREEQFHSFCGVPMVRSGEVTGVLVVQSRRAEALDPEREAFLATLAAHLALVMERIPAAGLPQSNANRVIRGVSGAPGHAIGPAHVCQSDRLHAVAEETCDDPQRELGRWRELRHAVAQELHEEQRKVEDALGTSLASVIEAYRLLLDDPAFNQRIEAELGAGMALPTAIRKGVQFFSDQFLAMDDPYLQARHEDIEQLGEKLYRKLTGDGQEEDLGEISAPCVLIGTRISVSDIARIPSRHLQAVVCQSGAALSHIAIFANALGIPAVMGVGEMSHLTEGETVIVDGDAGELVRFPSDALQEAYRGLIESRRSFNESLHAIRDLPAQTTDGTHIELLVNTGLQADIMPGIRCGAEGVGLYRTEIPFMINNALPSEEEQIALYSTVISAYGSKPVYMRTLDIGGDKPLPYLPELKEENPALGWRGIRFTLDNVQLLMTQVRAIIRAAEGRDNVQLLFPMVGSTEELDQCIRVVDDACRQLRDEGFTVTRPRIGVMLEIPGTAMLLPFWTGKIDFISIGSNDLSQYLLALDRNNPRVGRLFDALHPAVLHEIRRILGIARDLGLPVCVCGEMASDPISAAILIGLGVRRMSLSSARLPLIRYLVRALSLADAERFAARCLQADRAQTIRRDGQAFVRDLLPEVARPPAAR